MKKDRGFTLIELMVVVIVIAVLAAIALPSYLNQTRKSRRSQAESVMQQIALKQEQFRADCTQYATGFSFACPTGAPPTFPALSTLYTQTYYNITMPASSTSAVIAYTIKAAATATGTQNRDRASGIDCSNLYFAFGKDTNVDGATGCTATAAGQITKCPAACWSQQ